MTERQNQQTKNTNEHTPYRLEHLDGMDVVINLDYPNKTHYAKLISVLQKFSLSDLSQGPLYDFTSRINTTTGEKGERLFFLKSKGDSQEMVDFILQRTNEDPIRPNLQSDFDTEARLAMSSILSEVRLSRKVRSLVMSQGFQEIAKTHGFRGITFVEPILAFVQHRTRLRFMVYPYVENKGFQKEQYKEIPSFVSELRNAFQLAGIVPHDLSPRQIMIDAGNNLILCDIEAYTENHNSGNFKST